jgi:hypothetical protein
MAVVTMDVVEEMMKKLMENQMVVVQKLLESRESNNGHQEKKMGQGSKIPEFNGKQSRYFEWLIKLKAYFKVHLAKSEEFIHIAMESDKVQTDGGFGLDDEWKDYDEEEVKKFSATMYNILINNTTDDAFTICNSTKTCQGLEALRLLRKRYDPKSPGSKRAVLKGLMCLKPAKKLSDLESTVLKLEEMVKKYETMAKLELPDDLVVTLMIDVCSAQLKEHLELTSKSMLVADVREEIFSYIERTRNQTGEKFDSVENEGIHYMNKDVNEGWEDDAGTWDWNERPQEGYEELHYFGGKGGSKSNGGKSYGKSYGKGFNWDPKGKGKSAPKGGYASGKGFGDDGKGGKGKGKGGFQGDCFWCGKFGHSQRDCPDKDAYMSWVRKGKAKVKMK